MSHLLSTTCALIMLLSISSPAHAYLDPVTGSLIIQGLVALIAGIIASVRSVRQKIITFFRRKS